MQDTRCHAFQRQLSFYVDGELEASRLEATEAHVQSCTSCKEDLVELEGLTVLTERIRGTQIPDRHRAQAMDRALARATGRSRPPDARWLWVECLLRHPRLAVAVVGAAAAVLVAATLLLPGTDGALCAQVCETPSHLSKVECYHVVHENGEAWVSLARPPRIISRRRSGTITMTGQSKGVTHRYSPQHNRVFVYTGGCTPRDPAQLLRLWLDRVGRDWRQEPSTIRGTQVHVYTGTVRSRWVRREQVRLKLWADPQTGLPLRFEAWRRPAPDADLALATWADYDYPDGVPGNLSEVGVPQSAEVVDFRTAPDTEHMLRDFARKRQALDNYRAVVLTSWTRNLETTVRRGEFYRFESYYAWHSEEPIVTADDAERFIAEHYPWSIYSARGRRVVQYNQNSEPKIESRYGCLPVSSFVYLLFEGLVDDVHLKPRRRTLTKVIGKEEADGETLLKVVQTTPEVVSDGEPIMHTSTFWLNVGKDYLIHKVVRHDYLHYTRHIEEYAQTKRGHWYPKTIVERAESVSSGKPGQARTSETRYTVLSLETGLDLPDTLFPTEGSAETLLPNDGREVIQMNRPR